MTWWRDAVLYQIYPRSFADSDGDGVGDLRGIIDKLDHLSWLGVDGVWLNPITVSPNADWGYDVSDFCAVDPALGTLDDLDDLVAAVRAHDLAVVLDIVPNHTSVEHPWFVESRSSRDHPARDWPKRDWPKRDWPKRDWPKRDWPKRDWPKRDWPKRDWYVWADPAADGGPPNNWHSEFSGTSAWILDESSGQYSLRQFLPEQADLDWWNPEVRAEFERILRFWFDRGVAGFRIDVAHMVVKDRELRDNPIATEDDDWLDQLRGQVNRYNANQPEVHDVYRAWRALAESYDPPRLLVGETFLSKTADIVNYYGDDDELQLAFSIPFILSPFDAHSIRTVVEEVEALTPPGSAPCYPIGNHDLGRFATRWCGNDPRKIRLALLMFLSLRGTLFLYYGDELGLVDTAIPKDRILDPVHRDPQRTPMVWSDELGAGFTSEGVEPWLPFGDLAVNVRSQHEDPDSVMHLTRDLIALRRELDDLRSGAYRTVTADEHVWVFRRGDAVVVALNFADEDASVDVSGVVRICTNRKRDGDLVTGHLHLAPYEATVIDASVP